MGGSNERAPPATTAPAIAAREWRRPNRTVDRESDQVELSTEVGVAR